MFCCERVVKRTENDWERERITRNHWFFIEFRHDFESVRCDSIRIATFHAFGFSLICVEFTPKNLLIILWKNVTNHVEIRALECFKHNPSIDSRDRHWFAVVIRSQCFFLVCVICFHMKTWICVILCCKNDLCLWLVN